MPIIRSIPNLPIVKRIKAAYEALIGSEAQEAKPVGTPTKYAENLPTIGATVPSPMRDKLNKDYIEPQQQFEKYVAGDVALMLNSMGHPECRAAYRPIELW